MNRERLGGIGGLVLCAFLILFGLTLVVSIAIPGWVTGILAIAAGILLLVGR